jgi:MFS family permease
MCLVNYKTSEINAKRFGMTVMNDSTKRIFTFTVIEFIGPKHRGLAGVLFAIPFAIGYLLLPIIAYFIRDWRSLQLTLAAFSSLLILTWWQIPESPRWLLTQGRSEEAENVLRKIARINDRALPENFGNLVRQISAEVK